jgi:endonuclease III
MQQGLIELQLKRTLLSRAKLLPIAQIIQLLSENFHHKVPQNKISLMHH